MRSSTNHPHTESSLSNTAQRSVRNRVLRAMQRGANWQDLLKIATLTAATILMSATNPIATVGLTAAGIVTGYFDDLRTFNQHQQQLKRLDAHHSAAKRMIWLMRLSIAFSLILLTVYGGLNLFSSEVDTVDMAIGLGFAIGLSACLPSLVRKFTVSQVKYAIEDLNVIPIGEQLEASREQQLDLTLRLEQARVARDELANDNRQLEREVNTLTGQTTRLSEALGSKENENQQLSQEIASYKTTNEELNNQLFARQQELKQLIEQGKEDQALHEETLANKDKEIETLKSTLRQRKVSATNVQEEDQTYTQSSPGPR